MKKTIQLLILFVSVLRNETARIFAVYPTPSISHQVVFRPLTLELVKQGHEVVVLTTDPAFSESERPSNLTEIDVHDISYEFWKGGFKDSIRVEGKLDDFFQQAIVSKEALKEVVEIQFSTKEVQKILKDKSQKFDLLILEAHVEQLLGLTHLFKAPTIQFSSFGSTSDNLDTVGAPSHPFHYPTIIMQKVNNLTLWDKLWEVRNFYHWYQVFLALEPNDSIIKRLFGPDIPPFNELKKNVDMIFLNAHPLWEINRPVPTNMIYVGGLHLDKPEKDLPKDLKSYLDSSENGVIYVSFGTNVDPARFTPDKLQVLVKVFSELPFDVLWKWNYDDLPGRGKNIKIGKWFPQSDLLRHRNIKLFVTKGGLQSSDEAIIAGVPVVGVPVLGDQWYNVEQYVYHKVGARVDLDTIDEDKLRTAINTVVNDSSYRSNMEKLRSRIRDQKESPLERAVWWAEYVLRHNGSKHLRSPVANMPLSQYFELELISWLLAGIFLVTFLPIYVSYLLLRQCSRVIKLKQQ